MRTARSIVLLLALVVETCFGGPAWTTDPGAGPAPSCCASRCCCASHACCTEAPTPPVPAPESPAASVPSPGNDLLPATIDRTAHAAPAEITPPPRPIPAPLSREFPVPRFLALRTLLL